MPAGGFHSSEDADSEGVEGKFYVWDDDEFMKIAPDAADYYGVTSDGNFEGHNILTAKEGHEPPARSTRALARRAIEACSPGQGRQGARFVERPGHRGVRRSRCGLRPRRLRRRRTRAADFVLRELAESPTELLHTFRRTPYEETVT